MASRFEPIENMLGGAGILVTPGDAGGLAVALLQLLDDRALAANLGASACRRAQTLFGWDRVAEVVLAAAPTTRAKGLRPES